MPDDPAAVRSFDLGASRFVFASVAEGVDAVVALASDIAD